MSEHDKLNDVITRHWHVIDDVCRELDDISQSGHDIGLDRMSKKLDYLNKALADSKRELRTAYGASTVARVKGTEQATANMVSAVLAAQSDRARIGEPSP